MPKITESIKKWGIKKQIQRTFLFMTIASTLLIGGGSYISSKLIIEKNYKENFRYSLEISDNIIQIQMDSIIQLGRELLSNEKFINTLTESQQSDNAYFTGNEAKVFENALSEVTSKDMFISEAAVIDTTGKLYCYRNNIGRTYNYIHHEILKEDWIKKTDASKGREIFYPYNVLDTQHNPETFSLVKKMINIKNGKTEGYLVINIRKQLMKNSFVHLPNIYGSNCFLALTKDDEVAYFLGNSKLEKKIMKEYQKKENFGNTYLFSEVENSQLDWKLVSVVRKKDLMSDSILIGFEIMLIILTVSLLSGLLAKKISDRIYKPLNQLGNMIHEVGKGARNLPQKFDDSEVGQIGNQFREMVNNNLELRENLLSSQVKEREAELMLLQTQINPHFLYNTLDSIYCMAIIEKQDNIAQMVEKVWDNHGESSDWNAENAFVTALLKNEWQGDFISAESEADADCSKATYVRKMFSMASKKVQQAYITSTALGLYKLFLNGKKVGTDELAPGWTSYDKHLLYQTYEVTELLQSGDNMLGAMLGAGWYKGLMGFLGLRNNYGKQAALLCELYIQYKDGTEEIIKSDISWEGADAPIIFSEIYDGEIYDASKEMPGWNCPGNSGGHWESVNIVPCDKSVLAAQSGCRVKVIETLPVKEIFRTPQGDTVVDFGQNLSGWIHFSAHGKKGDVAELQCFEVLNKDGNVYTANLRKAKQTIRYIFNEEGSIEYQPSFTFQGFRYICIKSWPGRVKKEDLKVCVVHSDLERTGDFECSNPDLNQLQHNILWGLKSNFVDVPTDCPQRNKRVGWTGDAQIFCRTACYLMNAYTFYKKWLRDLAVDQMEDGGVPHIIPDIFTEHASLGWLLSQGSHSAAAWADAAVINPWTLYLVYGDTQILEDQYESMKKWIGFMEEHSQDYIWNYRLQFGDWVALDAEEGSYFGATPNELTCTAFFAYSTELFSKICRILKREKDAEHYKSLYKRIVKKYQETFFTHTGHLTAQTQTAQIVTLHFNLAPEEYVKNIVQDLLKLLKKENGHLVTGFIGTPYFCHVLSQNGCLKEAFELLLKDDFPSWLYQVKMGATTVWEHWDGIKPDGSMWSPNMNSFNHYAYGAVGEWLYRVVAGIEIKESAPGYKQMLLQPHLGGDLEYAGGTYQSVYGEIKSKWRKDGDQILLDIKVPANTSADIWLEQAVEVTENDGILFTKEKTGYKGTVGSGEYQIQFSI